MLSGGAANIPQQIHRSDENPESFTIKKIRVRNPITQLNPDQLNIDSVKIFDKTNIVSMKS
jgi:hypothetical protein